MERILYPEDINIIASSLDGKKNIFIIADANVAEFANTFCRQIGICEATDRYLLDATEENKSISSISEIISWLIEREAGRDAMLIGIGGGITTDITGFTASIYKRGIKYVLVPTTLLAQSDAAIGGKTGINFNGIKNILGTFAEPEWIYIAPEPLASLTLREFMSGVAEILKTFIISDTYMYAKAVDLFIRIRKHNLRKTCGIAEYNNEMLITDSELSELQAIISSCIRCKSNIVMQDRNEKGLRMLLNLGHTFGHAAEAVMMECCRENRKESLTDENTLTHGEAVAAGIIAAAEISVKKGMLSKECLQTITNDFKSLGYKTLQHLAEDSSLLCKKDFFKKISDFVRNDKKRKEDFINFVFIRRIGEAVVGRMDIRNLLDMSDGF